MRLEAPYVLVTSAEAMGGGTTAAMAQGGWQHHGADALVLYALTIAALLSLVSTMGVAGGGRWLYTRVGVTGGAGCCVRPWDERTLDENGL